MKAITLRSRLFLTVLASLLAVAITGCGGGGPKVVEISGTVTRGGKPLKDFTLNFHPENGRTSWGVTDSEGRYTLHYTRDQDGACVGKHKVIVEYTPRPSDPGEEFEMMEGRFEIPPDVKAIEEKYGDLETTPLEFDIQKSQTIDLELD